MDEKIREIEAIQSELEHRTEVEERAWSLIGQCRFEEAMALLDTI